MLPSIHSHSTKTKQEASQVDVFKQMSRIMQTKNRGTKYSSNRSCYKIVREEKGRSADLTL